jgi:hypothetical protein
MYVYKGELDAMAIVSVKRVSKEKFQQEVEDSVVSGWALKRQNENVAILTKTGGWGSGAGHILVFLLTAWLTIFIGNFLYALYCRLTSGSELQIKVEN